MPSAFGGLNMMGNALRIFQRALDVTGHNIANVNTPGYSRQRIVLGTNTPDTLYGLHPYQVGTGVNIQTVMRIRSALLDARLNAANADLGSYESLASSLKQIESIFPEPSQSGISDALGKFFDSWSSLSANPGDSAAKLQVRAAGQTLAQRVRGAFGELQRQETETKALIENTFNRIDDLSSRIATLNKEIVAKKAGGGSPNDLMDARDQALEELSGLVAAQSHEQPDGSITVYAGEILLVPGTENIPIPRTYDAASLTLSKGADTYRIGNGQLSGWMQSLQKIDSFQSQLDLFANTLRTQINTIHRSGQLADGTTNIDFFNDSVPQTGAGDFDLSAALLASSDNVVSGASGSAGDGGIALSLSRVRDANIAALGGKTFKGFYTDFVGGIGRDVAFYEGSVDTQIAVLEQVNEQRQAEMGVNIDDEMTSLMQFQRSYQAAARALTVLNEVTEDLVNMIR